MLEASRMDLGPPREVDVGVYGAALRAAGSSVIGCALVSAEHERMRQRATPDLQASLHRAHETVRIFAGMLCLQPVEQLATRR